MSQDPAGLGEVAADLFGLAGRRGPPEAVQTIADAYPGSTTSHIVYELGVALSLVFLDLAEDVAATAALMALPPNGVRPPGSDTSSPDETG